MEPDVPWVQSSLPRIDDEPIRVRLPPRPEVLNGRMTIEHFHGGFGSGRHATIAIRIAQSSKAEKTAAVAC
jgi:hypothetical protein